MENLKQNEECDDVPAYLVKKQVKSISIKKIAKIVLKNKNKYDYENIYVAKSKGKIFVNVAYKNKKDCFKKFEITYNI